VHVTELLHDAHVEASSNITYAASLHEWHTRFCAFTPLAWHATHSNCPGSTHVVHGTHPPPVCSKFPNGQVCVVLLLVLDVLFVLVVLTLVLLVLLLLVLVLLLELVVLELEILLAVLVEDEVFVLVLL
jgi:hypothetical protein